MNSVVETLGQGPVSPELCVVADGAVLLMPSADLYELDVVGDSRHESLGGLDERLEEIQARQQHEPMARPSPKRPAAVLDDETLWLAVQNVTISAELYRRLAVLEQRVTEIHAAGQAAQTLLHRQRPAPPPPAPLWHQLAPELLRLLALMGAVLLLLVLFGVTVGLIYRPKPVQPLLPPPAARLLVPPAELPPEPRPRREEPADAI